MHILGLSCYAHDASAALLADGRLVGFVEEERFVRRKHAPDFPRQAIRWCLREAGISARDLDHIVYYWNPYLGLGRRLLHVLRHFPGSRRLVRSRSDKFLAMLRLPRTLRAELDLRGAFTRIHFAEHHLLHAASAFLTSPHESAAVLSIDAIGEWWTTWLGNGQGLDLRPLRKIGFPHSLGLVYGAVTEHLGFEFTSGEGKVMALAAYGDPARYRTELRDMLRTDGAGRFRVDPTYFAYHVHGKQRWWSEKFIRVFGPPRTPGGEITQHHKDLAAALQCRTEEVALELAHWLHRRTRADVLCLAGGVCLNSVLNGRLLREGPFREIWVPPAVNDAGTSIGACYWLWNQRLRRPRGGALVRADLGPAYGDAAILEAARSVGLHPARLDDAPAQAADLIAQGKVVGWFDGRLECGPRALGHRSILADPRDPAMQDRINARVKFREPFRPFAPAVLEEHAAQCFEGGHPSPFMSIVQRVRAEMRQVIPAVTHVDGTARVQTVSRERAPRFHRLISRFRELTGVPCVLNTSFNVRGEPIVNTPQEAIACYLRTGMDALVLGDHLLSKEPAVPAASAAAEAGGSRT
jgi:carbamoyltransferase